MLKHGTPRSLAVLDELGRGTATFDGAAIASAVLTELKSHVCCPVPQQQLTSSFLLLVVMASNLIAASNLVAACY